MCRHCLTHRDAIQAFEYSVSRLPEVTGQLPSWAQAYLDLTEEIPAGLPDGTGGFSPLGWVRWAKKQLGYYVKEKESRV